ncbi:DUF397 domain-containing protein [Actinokineospora diospyrosa]|uniref:DUF397 domain-containing protein n=1 Tax=Actinokineospora diospyrosa TaxID=103728 RepID=A0ABT1IKX3_9PSEU|nr:DUF397 domain-containing protein [Actinokineospora diospyrosa]MCP2273307.1 protein of unknown function (DUF397) [Actinokineospora diospyrosa]
MNGPQDTGWFKSSFSNTSNDNCVEVRFIGGVPVAVRDSKNPSAGLHATSAAWAHLVRSVR